MNQGLFRVWTATIVVLIGCSLVSAQEHRVELTTGPIGISLVLPNGLEPFSEERMAIVREKGIAAKFIFSDSQGDLIAAINTFGSGASEAGLGRVADEIAAVAKKQGTPVDGFTRALITMNGKNWLRVSFKEGSSGSELINEYFVTDWIGQYILINFSTPAAKYASYRDAVELSARSVQLGLIAESDEPIPPVRHTQKGH